MVELRGASGDLGNGVVVGGSRERGDGGEDRHLDKKSAVGAGGGKRSGCVPLLCAPRVIRKTRSREGGGVRSVEWKRWRRSCEGFEKEKDNCTTMWK